MFGEIQSANTDVVFWFVPAYQAFN